MLVLRASLIKWRLEAFTIIIVELLLDHHVLVLRHRSAGVGVPVPAGLRRDVGHIGIECRGWIGILIPTLVDANLLQLSDALHKCLMELHEPVVKMSGQFVEEACRARGLLDDDQQWHVCMEEAARVGMPSQIRYYFSQILAYNAVENPWHYGTPSSIA